MQDTKRLGLDPWVGKISWRRERPPTPVFCPREFHRLYSPWGCKELDSTERLNWTELNWCYVRCAKSLQLCLTLCNPMDHSPSGSSVHETSQARILEWVAVPSSRGSSQPRDGTRVSYVSCIGRWVLYHDNQIIIHILVSILSYLSWNIKIHSCIILHKCIP